MEIFKGTLKRFAKYEGVGILFVIITFTTFYLFGDIELSTHNVKQLCYNYVIGMWFLHPIMLFIAFISTGTKILDRIGEEERKKRIEKAHKEADENFEKAKKDRKYFDIMVIETARTANPKWFDKFVGETFEVYQNHEGSSYHLSPNGLAKLNELREAKKGELSMSAIIYPDCGKPVTDLVGNEVAIGMKKLHMSTGIAELNSTLNEFFNNASRCNGVDGKPLCMDLSDMGNAVGIVLQDLINKGVGDEQDFMSGLQHGMSLKQK